MTTAWAEQLIQATIGLCLGPNVQKHHHTAAIVISTITIIIPIRESVPLRWSAPRQLERQLHHSLPTYSRPKVAMMVVYEVRGDGGVYQAGADASLTLAMESR